MLTPRVVDIIRHASNGTRVPPLLAVAICEVESNGNNLAVRYEAHWKYEFEVEKFAKLNRITVATEKMLQACSFGLLQVMGTVARELGYEASLIQLTDPYIGAKYGCIKLDKLMAKFESRDDVIAAYNAGSPIKKPDGSYVNQEYVDKVKSRLKPFSGPL